MKEYRHGAYSVFEIHLHLVRTTKHRKQILAGEVGLRVRELSPSAMVELVAPTKRNGGKPPVKAIYHKTNRYAQRGTWLIPSENLFRVLLTQAENSVQDFDEATKLPAAAV